MKREFLFFILSVILLAITGCGESNSGFTKSTTKTSGKLVGPNISVSNALEDQQNPKVVYLQDKKLYFAAWEDWRNRLTTGTDIYGQFVKEDGTMCGSSFIVNNASGNQTVPTVAYKPGGNLVVAWQDTVGNTIGGYVNFANFNPPADTDCLTYTGPGTLAATPVGFNPRHLNNTVNNPSYIPTSETIGSSSGKTSFFGTLTPPVTGAISVYLDGTLAMSGIPPAILSGTAGTGAYDPTSGILSLSFTAAPIDGTVINAFYKTGVAPSTDTNTIIATVSTPQNFNYTTSQLPANNKSLTVTVGKTPYTVILTADATGNLNGTGGSGTVNLLTGAINVSFDAPPAKTDSIKVNYSYSLPNWSYQSPSTFPDPSDTLVSRKKPVAIYDNNRDEFWIAWVESRSRRNSIDMIAFDDAPSLAWARVGYEFGDSSFAGYVRLDGNSLAQNRQSLTSTVSTSSANRPASPAVIGADILRDDKTTTSRYINNILKNGLNITNEYEYYTDVTSIALSADSTSPETLFVLNGRRNKGTLKVTCVDANSNSLCDSGEAVSVLFTQETQDAGMMHNYALFDKEAALAIQARLIETASVTDSFNPTAAFDPITKRFLVAWEDLRGGVNTKIYGQLINSGGGLYNANFNITGSTDIAVTSSRQTAPSIAYDGLQQRYFVAWQDGRNSTLSYENLDIYGQYIDAEGSLRGDNYFIATDTSNQYAPSITYSTGLNQFFAVWKDARNTSKSGSDIYGQLYSQGQPHIAFFNTDGTILAPPLLDFKGVQMGTTKSMQFVVKNTGDASLDIDAITQIADPFKILPLNSVTLSPGASTTLTVTYSPIASGTNNSSVTIKSNGGNQLISLVGLGTGSDPLQIKTASLQDGTPGQLYPTTALSGYGGSYPYTWTEPAGVLASLGLALNKDTGVISGTINVGAVPQIYNISIILTDQTGFFVTTTFKLNIGLISISTSTLNSSSTGVLFTQQLGYVGGTAPVIWTSTGTLPNGLTLSPTGVLSGIPTKDASFTFDVTVTDANGAKSTKTFTMLVKSPIAISTTSISDMKVNNPVSITLQANGGTLPYTWARTKGAFPTGISDTGLDVSGGNLSGTPTAAGDYTFEISVTDALGTKASTMYTVSVRDPLNITTPTLKSWALNQVGYSDTLTAMGGRGTYAWSLPDNKTATTANTNLLPAGLSLNASSGVISGTPTAAGIFPITVQVIDTGVVPEAVTKKFNIVISTAMVITNTSAATTTKSAPYTLTLLSSGGTEPKSWTSTTLPSGLNLNSQTGVVSGSALEAGLASVIFTVTDYTGATATQTLTIDVKPDLQITTTTLKPWTQGVGGYSDTFTAIGGLAPFKWSWVGFPDGLVLNSATGQISGTPTNAGSYSFLIVVLTDANGATASNFSCSLIINPQMAIATTSLSPATPGIVYQGSLSMSGGTAPFTWAIQNGTLPIGLALDTITGIISGIPTTAGTSQFSIQVSDATGSTKIQALSIAVAPQLDITNASPLTSVALNAAYNQTLIATGGRVPYVWSIASGTLPTGLTLAQATGVLSGNATAPGKYDFVAQVTDADSRTTTKTLSITVGGTTPPAALSITTTSLPAGEVSKAYTTTTLAATGGTVPRSWTLVSGTLPAGLTLASATGVISGTPTAGGHFDLIFQVTDADLKSTTQSLSIVVLDPSISGGSVQFTDGTNQITLLGYGNAYKGTSTRKTVTIKNTSSTAVAIASISSDSSVFTVFGAPFSIAANGTATLDVSFTPVQIMAYSGSITLTDLNGNKYQLAVTGSGIGANVELKSGTGTVSYFNTLATTSLPTQNKPADFVSLAAADFQITGVTPGAKVTVAVTFASMPANPLFYKIINNNWVPLTGAMVSGNVVTFDITDNGDMDSDITAGVIRDPIVVGSTSSSTGGTVSAGGGGGGGCFIATAAYGSYLEPNVMVLRHFRDDLLLQSDLGTAFVKFYYKNSPPIADFIAQHDSLRMLMRFALTPLIFAVKYPAGALGIIIIGLVVGLRRMRRIQLLKELKNIEVVSQGS